MRHHCQAIPQRDAGDLKVVRADGGPGFFKLASYFRTQPGAAVVEGQRHERFDKNVQLRVFASGVDVPFGTLSQLIDNHGTENDLTGANGLPARDQMRIVLPQQIDAGVGIWKEDHDSGSRSSNSPCGGRSRWGMDPAT